MYYSFACTSCGRVFYTYNRSKEHASDTLYQAVKQHLIAYNEDHKEYEMDDGEEADSDQIYEEMHESNHPPPGGYEAIITSDVTGSSHASHNSAVGILIFLVLLIIVCVIVFFFYPEVLALLKQ